MLNDLYLDALK